MRACLSFRELFRIVNEIINGFRRLFDSRARSKAKQVEPEVRHLIGRLALVNESAINEAIIMSRRSEFEGWTFPGLIGDYDRLGQICGTMSSTIINNLITVIDDTVNNRYDTTNGLKYIISYFKPYTNYGLNNEDEVFDYRRPIYDKLPIDVIKYKKDPNMTDEEICQKYNEHLVGTKEFLTFKDIKYLMEFVENEEFWKKNNVILDNTRDMVHESYQSLEKLEKYVNSPKYQQNSTVKQYEPVIRSILSQSSKSLKLFTNLIAIQANAVSTFNKQCTASVIWLATHKQELLDRLGQIGIGSSYGGIGGR